MPPPMDQHPTHPSHPEGLPPRERSPHREHPPVEGRPLGEERRSPGPGSRRPSPKVVALVLIGIVLALSAGAYALVTAWLG